MILEVLSNFNGSRIIESSYQPSTTTTFTTKPCPPASLEQCYSIRKDYSNSVFASCFNNINLTVLILMHNGLTAFRNPTLLSKLGRCKISPTGKQSYPHCVLVVIRQHAHYRILEWFGFHLPLGQVSQSPFELFYLGELVWEGSNNLSLQERGFIWMKNLFLIVWCCAVYMINTSTGD